MREIRSIVKDDRCYNDVTFMLDKHCNCLMSIRDFTTYMLIEKYKSGYALRYPGLTVGEIEVSDGAISNIRMYEDCNIIGGSFNPNLLEDLRTLIGCKLEDNRGNILVKELS